jgi:4-amino-4-deoxy-L-arabinose transferase-like glycosyltransferase
MILGQRLQAGYTGQPPLYTWLQIGFFAVFGHGVLALALLKNLLLFLTYAGSFFAARRLGFDAVLASASALSLLLLADIGWESQRDLTHSVLVTSMAALTLWLGCTMASGVVQLKHYALFGVLVGLGTLSKLNYLFFLAALVLSLYSLDRRLILRPAFLLSLLIAAVLVSPYALWMSETPSVAFSSMKKLDTTGPVSLENLAQNLASLGTAVLQFGVLFVVLFGATVRVWPRGWNPWQTGGRPAPVLLLLRLFWLSLATLLVYLLITGASTFKGRWLLPLLFYLPLLFFALAPEDAFPEPVVRRYAKLLLVAAILVSVGLLARVYVGPFFDKYTKPHFPAAELARALDERTEGQWPIVAENSLIAGNLKLHLPARFISFPPVDFPLPRRGDVLLVWDAGKDSQVPDKIMDYLESQSLSPVVVSQTPEILDVPLRQSNTRTFRLARQQVELTP